MSFPSRFKGKCKDCGKEWKKDDYIQKNAKGNWCKDGNNCQGCQTTTGTPKPEQTKPNIDVESKADSKFISFLKHEIRIIKEIEEFVKDDFGPDANPQRVGMYIKELNAAWKNSELEKK